jgi:hypothetical protein
MVYQKSAQASNPYPWQLMLKDGIWWFTAGYQPNWTA